MSKGKWQIARFIPPNPPKHTSAQSGEVGSTPTPEGLRISGRKAEAGSTPAASIKLSKLYLAYRWRAPGDAQPKLYRVSLGCDDTRANRRIWEPRRKQLEVEILAGTFDPIKWFGVRGNAQSDTPRTLGEFATAYLDELKGSDMTERTRKGLVGAFKMHLFGSPLADMLLSELNDGHISTWRGGLIASGRLGTATINRITRNVGRVINVAFRRGLIPRPQSPAALVTSLRDDETDDVDPYPLEEFLRILPAARDEQRRCFYTVMGLTGMRPAELYALPWSNVDFTANLIHVRQQLVDGEVTTRLKTKRSRRDIEMLPVVREALQDQRARTAMRSLYVFADRKGEPLTHHESDESWYGAIKRAGVPARRMYVLRHTYTSLMLRAGKPIQWVAAQLGHASVQQIDQTYGRWVRTPDSERLNLDELCARIRGAVKPSLSRVTG